MKTKTNQKGKLRIAGIVAGVASLVAGVSYLSKNLNQDPQLVYTANNPILRGGGKDGASRLYNLDSEGLEAVVETTLIVRNSPEAERKAQVYMHNSLPVIYWSGPMDENNPALDGFSWKNDLPLSPPQKTAMGLYIIRHTNRKGEYVPEIKVK